jgi:hypothetical protein
MKTLLIIYIVIVYTEYGVTKKSTNIDSFSIENIHLKSKMNSYIKSFSQLTWIC